MKNFTKIFWSLAVLLLLIANIGWGQLSLSSSGTQYTIDFSTTVSGVNNGAFATTSGSAFTASSPSAGQLNNAGWSFLPTSTGAATFGQTVLAGSSTQTSGGVATSLGIFAYNISSNS